MKALLVSLFACLAVFPAQAQLSLELSLDQDQFLPSEAIRVTVKVSNTSGQPLHLGDDPSWLTFNVESQDDFVVVKNGEVPVVEPFDLESAQRAIKHVDLQPYFQVARTGRYKVTATMRVKQWGVAVPSAPIHFDVVHGGEMWSQDFGVVMATNLPPESRKYTLIKANYLKEQLRLYVQVNDNQSGQIYRVEPLGQLVSFSMPEEQVDQANFLHVLWQTGGQSFDYTLVAPDGKVIARDIYDNFNSRPHLTLTSSGEVTVTGGVRRPKAGDLPTVQQPAYPDTPIQSIVPPAKAKSK